MNQKLSKVIAFIQSSFHVLANRLLTVAVLICLTISLTAQSPYTGMTPSGLAPGAPTGSYQLTDFESINPYNGNLSFYLPLASSGGRGQASLTQGITLGTKWTISTIINEQGENDFYPYSASPRTGPFVVVRATGAIKARCLPPPDQDTPYDLSINTLTRVGFTAGDGTEIELIDVLLDGQKAQTPLNGRRCPTAQISRGNVFKAKDGSNVTFVSDK